MKKKSFKKKTEDKTFPIVGMGASAGGLEAFELFFRHMPSDSGIAFVLVPHLDPTHASLMTDLLKRFTKMEVLEAKDGMPVEPDHVFITPPNKDMGIYHGALQLTEPGAPRGLRMPIDFFFRSLAEDHGEKTICILLSGTGTDGTMGLRAVHGVGGISMVQEPSSAKYEGMPGSAVKAGLADYVLPVEKMPEQLTAYVKHFYPKRMGEIPTIVERAPSSLQKILMLLRSRTGHDFSYYKKNTVHRRIERRMSVHQIEDPPTYVRYLQEHPDEVQMLFKELLIRVTNFFREPEAFEVLGREVIPRLLGNKPEDYPLRVWVPGCATGEEAYSLAIVLWESIVELNRACKIQIFGTDIDEESIAQARSGLYPSNIAIDVSPQRLKQFFQKEENGYRIKKEIRETVVFAVQNVITDTPFTKLDLISCRNLLIYLEPELQKKLMPLFHYSLKPEGMLFLGSSESVGGFTDLFTPIDKKWKVFQRQESASSIQAVVFAGLPAIYEQSSKESPREIRKPREITIPQLAQKLLLQNFVPPSVITNEKGDILYIHGQTGKYLEPAPGQPSWNILEMAREGLQFELRSGIHNAISKKKDVTYRGLQVRTNGEFQPVDVTIKPIHEAEAEQGLIMVVFKDVTREKQEKAEKTKPVSAQKHNRRFTEMEQELRYTKENLQATIEELQASNEELQSTNEELQSTNEEIQSANEELGTGKEELQSVNEELVTVNSELQSKIDQLSGAENDMRNLLDSTHIATIFLDTTLQIKRFTSETTKVFNLIPSDIGRPIRHIASNLEDIDLVADAQRVLTTLAVKEAEVRTKDQNWYLMRIMPYRTVENVIDGVSVTFADITQLKRATEERNKVQVIQAGLNYAEGIIDTVREPLIVLGADLRVMSANRSFYKTFRLSKKETEGRLIYELGKRHWDIPELRKFLGEILPQNNFFEDFEVDRDFPKIGRKKLCLNARRIVREGTGTQMILLAIEDVTPKQKMDS